MDCPCFACTTTAEEFLTFVADILILRVLALYSQSKFKTMHVRVTYISIPTGKKLSIVLKTFFAVEVAAIMTLTVYIDIIAYCKKSLLTSFNIAVNY